MTLATTSCLMHAKHTTSHINVNEVKLLPRLQQCASATHLEVIIPLSFLSIILLLLTFAHTLTSLNGDFCQMKLR